MHFLIVHTLAIVFRLLNILYNPVHAYIVTELDYIAINLGLSNTIRPYIRVRDVRVYPKCTR